MLHFSMSLKKSISLLLLLCFGQTTICPSSLAQSTLLPPSQVFLPTPGTKVMPSHVRTPIMLNGVKVDPTNPMRFDFILNVTVNDGHLRNDAQRLIKYFLACLSIPEKDLWVNLSPYEKDRMIPDALGKTELGRDLLAQDYVLKQLTASLLDPQTTTGKAFWAKVYTKAQAQFGTTNVPVNTFNKVWILADTARIFTKNNTAYVLSSHLKVMLDSDYLAQERNRARTPTGPVPAATPLTSVSGAAINNETLRPYKSSELEKLAPPVYRGPVAVPPVEDMASSTGELSKMIIKEIVIPEITNEVNNGENFAPLRQMYNAFILANWYKKSLKTSIINQYYSNQKITHGAEYENSVNVKSIYQKYLQAFKKGVINQIQEEQDPITHTVVPRKYFTGGTKLEYHAVIVADAALLSPKESNAIAQESNYVVHADMAMTMPYKADHDTDDETSWEAKERLEVAVRSLEHSKTIFNYSAIAFASGYIEREVAGFKDTPQLRLLKEKSKTLHESIHKARTAALYFKTIKAPLDPQIFDEIINAFKDVRNVMRRYWMNDPNADPKEKEIITGIVETIPGPWALWQSRRLLANGERGKDKFTLRQIVESLKQPEENYELIEEDAGIQFQGNTLSFMSVMFDLYTNARQAMKNAGKVKISVRKTEDGRAQIIVEDYGKGIQQQPKDLLAFDHKTGRQVIFNLNETTKNNAEEKGTGLGATEAWYVIQDMGGKIIARNKKDQEGNIIGAEIVITLPIANLAMTSQQRMSAMKDVIEEIYKNGTEASEGHEHISEAEKFWALRMVDYMLKAPYLWPMRVVVGGSTQAYPSIIQEAIQLIGKKLDSDDKLFAQTAAAVILLHPEIITVLIQDEMQQQAIKKKANDLLLERLRDQLTDYDLPFFSEAAARLDNVSQYQNERSRWIEEFETELRETPLHDTYIEMLTNRNASYRTLSIEGRYRLLYLGIILYEQFSGSDPLFRKYLQELLDYNLQSHKVEEDNKVYWESIDWEIMIRVLPALNHVDLFRDRAMASVKSKRPAVQKAMQRTILLVDDDPRVLRHLEKLFKKKGYSVITAESGSDALEKIRSTATIHLIITDLHMDNGTGIYLVNQLKKRGNKIPVFVFAGGDTDYQREAFKDSKQVRGYFSKNNGFDGVSSNALELLKNPAMSTATGGIEFNSSDLTTDETGDRPQFSVNDQALISQFQSPDFNGLYPVIVEIKPIHGAAQLLSLEF